MKFELFGRLRDNQDNSSNGSSTPDTGASSDIGGPMSNNVNNASSGFGNGLEDNVERMFSQGYSEEEIRDELRGQYSENEINQAVNRTITSSATGDNNSGGPEPMTPYHGSDETVSPMDEGYGQEQETEQQPPMDQANSPNPGAQQPLPQQGETATQTGNSSEVEELVETIVAENLERVQQEFENAYSEIDDIKEKLEELDDRVHDLEVRDDEDQTQFVQKMNELEEDIGSYQARMGGLEKAFQQVLPSLVNNVRELTSLVQEIKQERGIETEANVSQDDIKDIDMEDW